MVRKILPFLAFCFWLNGYGQNINHSGLFPTIDHSGDLTNRLSYGLYYFGAFNLNNPTTGEKPNFFAFYSEQSLSYKLTSSLSATGSYVYERQHPIASNYRNENRYYLQLTHNAHLGKVDIKNRLRFDGRYIQDRVTEARPFTNRLRYLIGAKLPLSGNYYLIGYNEVFFNTFKKPTAVYGENWAYAGVGRKFNGLGTFELGPLYIFWVNNSKRDLTNFYYLQLTWITHLDWRKQDKP